jgi:serine/threonine protein kinase
MSTEQQLQDGTIIGPYRVECLVGRGGMAEVYKVWHIGLHRYEALKLLPPAAALDATFVQRFLEEARLAAGLHHPHIVTTYAVSDSDGPPFYFSMQLIEGGDLADLIHSRGRVAPGLAIPILKQIALALDYAHRHGVVHRDVKPGNILLESDDPLAVHRSSVEAVEELPAWNVKVVDFGIARALGEGSTTRLTRAGMFMGTPEYMSPEQAGSGSPIDHRTDIYALGIVAYEMLCGRPPFRSSKDTSPLSVVVKHLNEAPPPPREFSPSLPETASEVLLRSLAKDPLQRFVSCTTFVEALASTTAGMEVSETAAKPRPVEDLPATPREYSRLSPAPPPAPTEIASTAVAPLADRLRARHSEAETDAGLEAETAPLTPQPETAPLTPQPETVVEPVVAAEAITIEEPATGTPPPAAKVSTLNASLYSLFNKDEQAAAAPPPSAFDFPHAATPSAPQSGEIKSEIKSAEIRSEEIEIKEAAQDRSVSERASRAALLETTPPRAESTPAAAAPHAAVPQSIETERRAHPQSPALVILGVLAGCVLLGFGWWRFTSYAPVPDSVRDANPIPTGVKNIAPVPTGAPRAISTALPRTKSTPKMVAAKTVVKTIAKPQPRATVPPPRRRALRRVRRRAPRVEYSPPRRVRRAPRVKHTRRSHSASSPKSIRKSSPPRIKPPDAY